MSFNFINGVFTYTTPGTMPGATNAVPGMIIASNSWNTLNEDVANSFSVLGPGLIPVIRGAQIADAGILIKNVNFAASAGTDIATFTVPVPSSYTGFRLSHMMVWFASATLNSVTVSLYTAPNAGGTVVISSTVVTITSSVADASNSQQVIVGASASNTVYNTANLYLHVTTSTSPSGTANVVLQIEPLP